MCFYIYALTPQITSTGELVYNINSAHKKPYEQLIIGQFQQSFLQCTSSEKQTAQCHLSQTHSIVSVKTPLNKLTDEIPASHVDGELSEGKNLSALDSVEPDTKHLENSTKVEEDIKIPQLFLLVSVPSCLHSKKPPLSGKF